MPVKPCLETNKQKDMYFLLLPSVSPRILQTLWVGGLGLERQTLLVFMLLCSAGIREAARAGQSSATQAACGDQAVASSLTTLGTKF